MYCNEFLYHTSVIIDHVCPVLSLVFYFVVASLFTTPPPACLTTSLQAATAPIWCSTLCTYWPLPACRLSRLHWWCYLCYESKLIADMIALMYYMFYYTFCYLLVKMRTWCWTLLVDVHVIYCHARSYIGVDSGWDYVWHIPLLKKQMICREWETEAWPLEIPSTFCDKFYFFCNSDTIRTIDDIRGVTYQSVVRSLLCGMIVSAKWVQWNLVALCSISISAGQYNVVQGVLTNRLHCQLQSLYLYLYLVYSMLCERWWGLYV